MSISKVCQRIKELFDEIRGKEIKSAARNKDDLSSWTRGSEACRCMIY